MAARKKKTTKKVVRKKKTPARARSKKTEPPWEDPLRTVDDDVHAVCSLLAKRLNLERIRVTVSCLRYGANDKMQPKHMIPSNEFKALVEAAHERALDAYRRDFHDQKALAIALYEDVIRDPLSKASDRINAQKRIDELLGHDYQARRTATPEDFVARVLVAMQQMDLTVPNTEG